MCVGENISSVFSVFTVSASTAEADAAEVRVSGHVLGRRRQQRRVQRLLRALLQLQERRHPALPPADGGRGRGPQPLRQLQLVRAQRGAAGSAEPAQEPAHPQVGVNEGQANLLQSRFSSVLVQILASFSLGSAHNNSRFCTIFYSLDFV